MLPLRLVFIEVPASFASRMLQMSGYKHREALEEQHRA